MSNQKYHLCTPITTAQIAAYQQLRFQELRQPWEQPQGSEIDDLESQAVHRMLCTEDGKVVAVGRFHKVSMQQAQIRYMAVDKNFQGAGLGNMLLAALEHEASCQGITEINLNAREVAVNFYQHNGYQLMKQVHTLYGDVKHFSMVKTLTGLAENKQVWLHELEQTWHQTIPLAKAMLIHPCFYNNQQLLVCANRDANINLHNTMFAGSIYSLATLTGWGWVHLLLKQQQLDADIVLADADIRYKRPLIGQPLAKTNDTLTSGNIKVLTRNRKARISVQVEVCDGDNVVATFNGTYVAIVKPNNG